MDWDQIETKWAAMTRRVRGDCASDTSETRKTLMRQRTKASLPAANVADLQARDGAEAHSKSSSE